MEETSYPNDLCLSCCILVNIALILIFITVIHKYFSNLMLYVKFSISYIKNY